MLSEQKMFQYLSLRDRLFCMALVEQLIVCAACCHIELVFAIMLLFYHIVSVLSFFIPFLFFSTLYWQISWNGWQCQHTLGLCSLLTRAVFKGLTSEIWVWCLCTAIYIHFVLYLCMDWFCRSVWKRRSRSEQFWNVHMLVTEFDQP